MVIMGALRDETALDEDVLRRWRGERQEDVGKDLLEAHKTDPAPTDKGLDQGDADGKDVRGDGRLDVIDDALDVVQGKGQG